MGVDSLARRLAAAALQKGEGEVTKDYVDAELAKKYDKTGGPISGDVTIQGDLTVAGTTTTEKEKQLLVEDNVIATNANKVDLQALLSGLAINKNADATYGIMYDPTDDTVKFGEGTLDENNKFVFKEGEGHPLSIRADSVNFTDAHLVRWDVDLMGFVDAGIAVNSLSKKIKSLDLSYGAQVVTYDTTDGMNIKSQTRITYTDNTTDDVNDEIEIPIVAGNGLSMDAITDNSKAVFKIDPEHSVYMETIPTAENAVPVYAKSSKTWIGLPATPSATASSVVTRDANGNMQVGSPVNDADAVPKSYAVAKSSESNIVYGTDGNGEQTQIEYVNTPVADTIPIRTSTGTLQVYDPLGADDLYSAVNVGYFNKKSPKIGSIDQSTDPLEENPQAPLSSISYTQEANIPTSPTVGVEYACTDFIEYSDLNSALQTKIDSAATKQELANAIAAEGPASTILTLSAPDTAENGTLTVEELATLQASENASIMFNHKKYDLGAKGHQEGYITYTHAGYENNLHILESITITISTRAWVLNTTEVLDADEIKDLVSPMIPSVPTWKTTAPTTAEDKAKVQFTKVTITTADETHFPGMNGRYTVVPGFTDDGFQFATVVCMQSDPAYEFPYIGSITSTMASGLVIKARVAPTYVSVVDPEVTFAYEYLW